MGTNTNSTIEALATPTEGDISEWNSLTREQQLKVLQEVSHHPDSTTPTGATMADIRERVRFRRLHKASA